MSNATTTVVPRIFTIPAECFFEALSYVPLKELCKKQAFATCKTFKGAAKDTYYHMLRSMKTMDCLDTFEAFWNSSIRPSVTPLVDISNLQVLQEMSCVTRVVFKHWHYRQLSSQPNQFAEFLKCESAKNLTSVDFIELVTPTSSETLSMFSESCPQLRALALKGYIEGNDDGLASLLKFKKLEKLTLDSNTITDASITTLCQMPSITDLDLSGSGITDTGITALLQNAPQLRALGIGGIMSSGAFEEEATATPLKAVLLHGQNLTALDLSRGFEDIRDVLEVVKKCTNLKRLDLTDLRGLASNAKVNTATNEHASLIAAQVKKSNPQLNVIGIKLPAPEKKE